MMKIKLNSIIKIAVTLAILTFLLWKVEFNAAGFGETLRSVRTGYFLPVSYTHLTLPTNREV